MKKFGLSSLVLMSMSAMAVDIDYSNCLNQLGLADRGVNITRTGQIKIKPGHSVMSLITNEKTTTKGDSVKKVTASSYIINNDKTQKESITFKVDQDDEGRILKLSTGDDDFSEHSLKLKKLDAARALLDQALDGDEVYVQKLKDKKSDPKNPNNWYKEAITLSTTEKEAILKFRKEQESKDLKRVHPREDAYVKSWAKDMDKLPLDFKVGTNAKFEYVNNRCYLSEKEGKHYQNGDVETVVKVSKNDCENAVKNLNTCQRSKELCERLDLNLIELDSKVDLLLSSGYEGEVKSLSHAGMSGESEKYKLIFDFVYLCKENFNIKENDAGSDKNNNSIKVKKN